MKINSNYEQRHLEAIHSYYYKLKEKNQLQITMKDVVLSWFAEGYAEQFRDEYLKNHQVMS